MNLRTKTYVGNIYYCLARRYEAYRVQLQLLIYFTPLFAFFAQGTQRSLYNEEDESML